MAVFEMGKLKAPGPDGFPPGFYQHYWDAVENDLTRFVADFFLGKLDLSSVNHTYIVLAPKWPNPSKVSHYCPISLCNVTYKIIVKVLANRL